MRLSDWLGEAGVWFHVNSDHHVMALVDLGYAHFHHLAFEAVDIGKMRDMLDHLARHGRWLGWGPARHGIAGNIASYVRIVEEECFVELYCDMEQLQADHVPRVYPDDRYSSNTWGPLPPRSYFRFDPVAIEYERESLRRAATCCRLRSRSRSGAAHRLHDPSLALRGARRSSPTRRGTTSATSSSSSTGPTPSGRSRACREASTRTRIPGRCAARLRRLAVVLGRAAASCSTRRARSTRSASSSSTRSSTARR